MVKVNSKVGTRENLPLKVVAIKPLVRVETGLHVVDTFGDKTPSQGTYNLDEVLNTTEACKELNYAQIVSQFSELNVDWSLLHLGSNGSVWLVISYSGHR